MSWKKHPKTIDLSGKMKRTQQINTRYIELMDEYRRDIQILNLDNDRLKRKIVELQSKIKNEESQQRSH